MKPPRTSKKKRTRRRKIERVRVRERVGVRVIMPDWRPNPRTNLQNGNEDHG
jgi:hypothetical protein